MFPDHDTPRHQTWAVFLASDEKASSDFRKEPLSRDYKQVINQRLAGDPEFHDAVERGWADRDAMQAVGRERFWLLAATRYPFKATMQLKRVTLGLNRSDKGSKEAKRERIKRVIKRSSPARLSGITNS